MIVRHSSGSYGIEFCRFGEALDLLPQCVVVSDRNVLEHWDPSRAGPLGTVALVPGESEKNLATFGHLLESLSRFGASRGTAVVALGGGVVGDVAGFAAAAFMRGVPLIQMPTTLLAMVDSSVGGKVGVDLEAGKNLAGAFYPPIAVYIALETLQTLPARQFANGTAEVWKYAFILDPELLVRLEEQPLEPAAKNLREIVERCIALKARVVEEDEHERTGLRAILNFGHTVGHAIEHVSGYGPILHGEAVSIGMVVEARLGERLGITPDGTSDRVRSGLVSQGLPVHCEWLGRTDALIDAMRRDKKASGRGLAFSLLTGLGECKLVRNVDSADVASVLETL